MRVRLWPRSLATRTAVVLLGGLVMVQALGLTIYALDRVDLQRLAQGQQIGMRIGGLYRAIIQSPANGHEQALHDMEPLTDMTATLDTSPTVSELPPAPPPVQRVIRISMQVVPMPGFLRWRELQVRGGGMENKLLVTMRLPTGEWLNVQADPAHPFAIWSETFLIAIALTTLLAAMLVIWAVRQFSSPMRDLAIAAERLGVDVNAAPLPEGGSAEAAKAAAAFNTMAARIRRYVQDRTFLLTAIGHDLRTPITRLKLRAEWMDDDEQRRKMLADLDELEGMVAATLAFGRDDANREAPAALDLAELLRTILDEAADARSDGAERTRYTGPDHLVARARPVAIKRAFTNLVTNALNYGDTVHVTLNLPQHGNITVLIEDTGPGIPAAEMERVFEPFYRLEASRNRETGGTGLGLPIVRNVLRAHGGDVGLSNRPAGGLRATVTLPV